MDGSRKTLRNLARALEFGAAAIDKLEDLERSKRVVEAQCAEISALREEKSALMEENARLRSEGPPSKSKAIKELIEFLREGESDE